MRHPFSTRKHPIRILAVALATLIGAACAPSTTIEQAWRAPITQYQQGQPPLQNVATLFLSNNQAMRRAAEDRLARDLAARGVRATPGYQLVSDAELGDLEAVKDKLRQRGFDGIVTMRIVDREQDLEYVPGGYWGYPGSWGGWGYPGYYGGGYYDPGYAYTETTYRIETNAYSLRTNQLVWSVLTRTVDPDTARELINETTKVIAGELTDRGLAG